ncbi:MAG: hypothetical protein EHM28_02750 [Spirochaetaceae bacterium]|nr:MAG: hypothetical protein EHM28_02750 [Spirochaetaceae bacterium]
MILVCDIGTSSLKAGIIDRAGRLVCYARVPLATFDPGFGPGEWMAAFVKAVRGFPASERKKIRAIGVSGQGPTLVPLYYDDMAGKPLFWFDRIDKTSAQARILPDTQSSKSYFLPLVDRLRETSPGDFQKVVSFLPCPEYFCFRLTGVKTALVPHEGFIPYYWNEVEMDADGMRTDKFPKLRIFTQPVGHILESAAAQTGLPAKLLVFCTGPDFIAAMLGTASHLPGSVNVRGGTSETINAVCDSSFVATGLLSVLSDVFRVVPGVLADTVNVSVFHGNIGRMHAIISETLFRGHNSYDRFCEAAHRTWVRGLTLQDGIVPQSGDVKPVSFAPPDKMDVLVSAKDLAKCFSGKKEKLTVESKALAFLEFAAKQLSQSCRTLAGSGIQVRELRVCGGLSKCNSYNRIRAKITGLPVVVPVIRDAELLGNAAVAMTALGDYSDPGEAAEELFQAEETIMP